MTAYNATEPHISDSHRIVALDAVRGVAVIGILLMNIISFSMPLVAYINPDIWGGTAFADRLSYALAFVFVDSKMRALFSLLFGASMVLVLDRANARDENGGKVHFARMLSLFLIGLFHTYFIWHGDILALYAMCGMIVFLLLDRPPQSLITIGIACIAAGTFIWLLVGGSALAMEWFSASAQNDPTISADAAELRSIYAPDQATLMREVNAMRGSYETIFAYRAQYLALPFGQLLSSGAETIGLMLIGAALMRQHFFADYDTDHWAAPRLRRVALFYGLPSLAILTILVGWIWARDFPPALTFVVSIGLSAPFDYMLAIAYAAGLMLWLRARPDMWLVQCLAATGRTAFTNYLGTSIVMTTLFYGYGLGLFGKVGRAEVYLFVLPAAAIMLAWSRPWLQHFRYGPMEWVWRSMARLQLQPMR